MPARYASIARYITARTLSSRRARAAVEIAERLGLGELRVDVGAAAREHRADRRALEEIGARGPRAGGAR
ncbi:MAG: hypothetical protein U0271_40795 [Polyangiaceae bacterium]